MPFIFVSGTTAKEEQSRPWALWSGRLVTHGQPQSAGTGQLIARAMMLRPTGEPAPGGESRASPVCSAG